MGGLTVLLGSLVACTGSPAGPLPTGAGTNPALPVQPRATATDTGSAAATPSPAPPNVIGMGIDLALSRMQVAGCSVTAEHIVNAAGTRAGQVFGQQVISGYCEVALSVSAGPPPTSVAACRSLAVHQGRGGVAGGNFGAALIFRNTGSAPCALRGYPDLSEQHNKKTVTARHTAQGYLGGSGEPLVTYVLFPGDSVSASYEASDNPPAGQNSCPAGSTTLVTAGGHTTTLPGLGSPCSGLEIHPYVPGSTGSDVR